MKIYQTNNEGFFIGATVADPDPLNKNGWLIPAGCVTETPPTLLEGQRAQLTNGRWVVVEPEFKLPPEPIVQATPTKAEQESMRRGAYAEEADPIFFMAQRGEATMAEWQAKVAEIKARFPYPEV